MDYQYKKFSVPMSSTNKEVTEEELQANWDRIFGKKVRCDQCEATRGVLPTGVGNRRLCGPCHQAEAMSDEP